MGGLREAAGTTVGFTAPALTKLDTFFQQWLYGTVKPTITGANFFVKTSTPGDVTGDVPPTLALSLGNPADLGTFLPGVPGDYTGSTTANVISSAGEASLTVVDTSSNAPGRLVNGAFALPRPLEAGIGGTYGPVSASPLALKSYTGPVSNDVVTVGFKQTIGANDALRTGKYAKTLTFTLSTTTP